jgi:hypothetical protein
MEQINLEKINIEVMALKSQMNAMQKLIQEDLEFARGTEEAWQEIDEGKCTTHNSVEEFFESLKNDN